MRYETIGGNIIDTDHNRITLRELRVGDRFTNRQGKNTWEVWGEKCEYNPNGGATRKCKNLKTGLFEHKLCRIQVIKKP